MGAHVYVYVFVSSGTCMHCQLSFVHPLKIHPPHPRLSVITDGSSRVAQTYDSDQKIWSARQRHMTGRSPGPEHQSLDLLFNSDLSPNVYAPRSEAGDRELCLLNYG